MLKIMQKYILFGVLFGCCFPIGAYLLDYTLHQDTTFSLIVLHKRTPLLYMIDTAPLFLGIFAGIGGYFRNKAQTLINQLTAQQDVLSSSYEETMEVKERLSHVIRDIQDITPYLESHIQALDGSLINILHRLDTTSLLAADSINHISVSLTKLSDETNSSSLLLKDSLDSLETSKKYLHSYETTLTKTEQDLHSSQSQLIGLVDKSKAIYDILQLLKDITSSTQLIAFNATIEAAKLKDSGGAFSVIAKEMTKLASASSTALDDIGPVLESIEADILHLSSSFKDNHEELLQGISLLGDFMNLILGLADEMKVVEDSILGTHQTLMKETDDVSTIANKTHSLTQIQQEIKKELELGRQPMENIIRIIEEIMAKVA